jgi:hypothetical protein
MIQIQGTSPYFHIVQQRLFTPFNKSLDLLVPRASNLKGSEYAVPVVCWSCRTGATAKFLADIDFMFAANLRWHAWLSFTGVTDRRVLYSEVQ